MVLTSKIVFNIGKFTVNVNEHPGLLFLNEKKRAKEDLFFLRCTRTGCKKGHGNLKPTQAVAYS